MTFQYIFFGADFHMYRCETPLRSIIMNHQIMRSKHTLITVQLILNFIHQFLCWCSPKQWI